MTRQNPSRITGVVALAVAANLMIVLLPGKPVQAETDKKSTIRLADVDSELTAAAAGSSRVVVLSDDFSGNLTDNWAPGRTANVGDGTHAVSVDNGQLKWSQNWNYIESKASFSNNLTIEFDYQAGPSSVQLGEFWVELVALTDAGHHTAGIYRGQYGNQNYHAINIGRAPSPSSSSVAAGVAVSPYLKTLAPGSPRQGTITFAYADQRVRMQFANQAGEVLSTAWVETGEFTTTKIRIWGMRGRFIDNVRVYAPGEEARDEVSDGQPNLTEVVDDFSGSLADNWVPGRAANVGGGTHAVSVDNGQLKWSQNWNYIESKASFSNNLTIEFDYQAGPSSVQLGEFWVELVALTDAGHHTAGIYRGQYGNQNYHAINIGRAPSPSSSSVAAGVAVSPYLKTLAPGSPRQGTITFAYADQRVRMQFANQAGEDLSTAWVETGEFTTTKIRIWGMRGRSIDNVSVRAAGVEIPVEQGTARPTRRPGR